jgi:acetylornithine deacetylase/succinyl-diaminopimelate desuccinylase-like protein
VDKLRATVTADFPALESDLEALVRIPSISFGTNDPSKVEESAQKVADLLRDAGMPEVEILRADAPDGTPGAPAVVASKPAPPGAPTILLYAHHDVQPIAGGWETEPFVPTRKGDRLYGRGAADDKAGVIAHVGALRALRDAGSNPQVGIKIFVEGEEENGSPSFRSFLDKYRDKLAADVIVVADSGNWKIGVPGLTTALRGLVDGFVEVQALDHSVHSGQFGGPVLDANILLARVIASLHDDDGNVAVEGLVTGPEPEVDYTEADFRADSSLLPGVKLAGSGTISGRLWAKPAISIIGIDATPAAEAANVIAPSARAKVSMRIPPGQDPQAANDALAAHFAKNPPFGAQVTWVPKGQGRPFQSPQDAVAMQAARSAFADAWGTAPVDIGQGGSIPFIADLLDVFPNAAILVTGVEDPDSRAHGANESVELNELQNVVLAEALLIERLA